MGVLLEATAKMKAAQEELRRIAKEGGEAAVGELLAPLFEFPISTIRWTQYTPYFNDGDACVFSVHGLEVALKDPSLLDDDEYDDDEDYDGNKFVDSWTLKYRLKPFQPYNHGGRYTEAQVAEQKAEHDAKRAATLGSGFTLEQVEIFAEALEEVSDTLESADDFLEAAFGDHVQVVVTPKGFTVHEYDHD